MKKLKTIDIKGKEYVEVNERIKYFRETYPTGQILTEMLSNVDGMCIFKAEVLIDNVIKAVGHAYEKENSTFINKTSYIENCVPLDTEILTINGWKYYYQLKENDLILSLNMNTKKIEYSKLLKINTYRNKPILKLKTSRFEVKCTGAHKWVVRNCDSKIEKKATNDLLASDKIITNVVQDVEPSILGKKLGWLICDSEITYTQNGMPSRVEINQSKYVEEVKELFGEGKLNKKYNTNWKDNYSFNVPAEEVRKIYGYFDIKNYKDLQRAMLNCDIQNVKGCYESMMLADGEKRGFSSTHIELIEAMQIMCVRLGISTGILKNRICKKSTKPVFTLPIKKTDGAYFSEIKVEKLPPQDVWCPTVENGTWFMKQGNFITLTSNCETSAVGRALGILGIGVDTSIASAEEVLNAVVNQNKDTDKSKETTKKEISATESQLNKIKEIYAERIDELKSLLAPLRKTKIEQLTITEASAIIKNNKKEEEK